MPAPRTAYLLAMFAAIATTSAAAFGGNQDSYFLSNEAAMTAGAVAATTNDPGAVWYNPAGLGANQLASLDLTATAFAVRVQQMPDAFVISLPDGTRQSQDVSSTQLLTVPTSLAFVREVGSGVSVGAGVFVPELDFFSLSRDAASVATADGSSLRQQADVSGAGTRYHVGPAIGWAVTPRYRIGASVFVVYETRSQVARFWWELERPGDSPSQAALLGEIRESLLRYSVEATIGLQADPARHVHVAFVLKGPRLVLDQRIRGDATSIGGFMGPDFESSGAPPLLFGFSDFSQVPLDPELLSPIAPPRAVFALAFDHGEGSVAMEVDASPGLFSDQARVDLEPVVNSRAGGTLALSDTLTLGGGVFTDRSPETDPEFPGFRVDYYGAALGMRLGTPLRLNEEGKDSLLFETTVGGRYAIGFGEAGAVEFDFTDVERGAFQPGGRSTVDVTFHEVALHVGTGVYF